MSRDFILYIDTPVSPEQALTVICKELGLEGNIESGFVIRDDPSNIFFHGPSGPGFHLSSHKPVPTRVSYIKDRLDITPKIVLVFDLYSEYDSLDEAPFALIWAVSTALIQIPGDAALIYNGFIAVLLRQQEQLTVDIRSNALWDTETLSYLEVPYIEGNLSRYS